MHINAHLTLIHIPYCIVGEGYMKLQTSDMVDEGLYLALRYSHLEAKVLSIKGSVTTVNS